MKTKQVTKLLAVMALAASPAAADPAPLANQTAGHPAPAPAPLANRTAARPTPAPLANRTVAPDPWASTAIVRIPSASAAPVAPLTLTALIELVSRPRTMPSGAPACGNVASRAPQPVDCGRSKP
ncbi:MAG: hypothetical protein IPQ07_40275 [Myxococcales bacterium]|nr:hypothetical protein [Myxococcales bacterium]